MKRKTLLLAAALAGACTVVSIAGGEPTGCPDFEVEQPRAGLSPRASRPVIRATDFGLSEANEHNAAAINAALAEAKRVGAARVELAPGTYRCFDGGRGATAQPDRSNIVIDGFTDFNFDGKGATLVFRRDHAPVDHQAAQLEGEANVEVRNCLRTVVENFNMDWDWENDPLAVWAKCVDRHVDEADNASYVDFELDRPHPKYPQHVPVQLLTPMSADRTGGRGHPMYFGMSLGHIGTKSEWLSPTRLRVWPFVKPDYGHFSPEALARYMPGQNGKLTGNVDVGGTFVLAHGYYGLNGFVLTSNRHFTLRNVDIWACRGFGVETRGSQQFWQLVNVNVRSKPGAKYPVTSTADAHHVAQSLAFGKTVKELLGRNPLGPLQRDVLGLRPGPVAAVEQTVGHRHPVGRQHGERGESQCGEGHFSVSSFEVAREKFQTPASRHVSITLTRDSYRVSRSARTMTAWPG